MKSSIMLLLLIFFIKRRCYSCHYLGIFIPVQKTGCWYVAL